MARSSNTETKLKKARHLASSNRLEEACELYTRLLRKQPQNLHVALELAVVYRRLGRLKDASQLAENSLRTDPVSPAALHISGSVLHRQGHLREACERYRNALILDNTNSETHYFLANALRELGSADAAENEYRNVLALEPDHLESLNNLSALLTSRGEIREAANLLEHALALQPDNPHMLINLGRALLHTGQAQDAEQMFRRVTRLQPGISDAYDNLLACLNYLPDREPEAVYRDHLDWNKRLAATLCHRSSWPNTPDPHRRLRIGYVSPDFHEHSVARFMEPVLRHHDKTRFEITCYSDTSRADETTRRLKAFTDHWNNTSALDHAQLDALVSRDEIDILVDLAGHTAHNRLPVFARKPAPLQLTWLGYPNTTGLSTMDYRLTDATADTEGITDKWHSEKLVRMPHGFLCFEMPDQAVSASEPPSFSNGFITFGSFNNLAKTTPEVIRTWSKLLHRCPGTRLALKSRATGDSATRHHLQQQFSNAGVDTDRIIFMTPQPQRMEHLATYRRIDIALDTFPYNGTTTSCEALWMGVPVITFTGRVHAARVGASLLHQLGLSELVASDQESYIEVAAELAENKNRLGLLHRELRDIMRSSALCNGLAFTRDLEQVYRKIWSDWCRTVHDGNKTAPRI